MKGVKNVSSSICVGVDNEMETNYYSDELGSSGDDASNNEKRPKYDKFRMKELDNNYKLSLDEFKETITKWSVLNERKI